MAQYFSIRIKWEKSCKKKGRKKRNKRQGKWGTQKETRAGPQSKIIEKRARRIFRGGGGGRRPPAQEESQTFFFHFFQAFNPKQTTSNWTSGFCSCYVSCSCCSTSRASTCSCSCDSCSSFCTSCIINLIASDHLFVKLLLPFFRAWQSNETRTSAPCLD